MLSISPGILGLLPFSPFHGAQLATYRTQDEHDGWLRRDTSGKTLIHFLSSVFITALPIFPLTYIDANMNS